MGKRTEERAKRVAEHATKSFANHVLTKTHDAGEWQSWRCSKPDSWSFGFHVTSMPGHLLVTGDIGNLWLSRERDMMAWLSKAILDPHYLLSKAVTGMEVKSWSEEAAADWIDGEERTAREELEGKDLTVRLEAIDRLRSVSDQGEHEFWNAWADYCSDDHADSSDPPSLDRPTSTALYCVEALRFFLSKLDEKG